MKKCKLYLVLIILNSNKEKKNDGTKTMLVINVYISI